MSISGSGVSRSEREKNETYVVSTKTNKASTRYIQAIAIKQAKDQNHVKC